jgi:hypothetical protein
VRRSPEVEEQGPEVAVDVEEDLENSTKFKFSPPAQSVMHASIHPPPIHAPIHPHPPTYLVVLVALEPKLAFSNVRVVEVGLQSWQEWGHAVAEDGAEKCGVLVQGPPEFGVFHIL